MKNLVETTTQLVHYLENKKISYAIMGGLAVRIYAIPRATFDIDLTIFLPRNLLADFYRDAELLGFEVSPANKAGWVDQVQELPVIKLKWFIKDHSIDIDIFLAETEFQKSLMSRRIRHSTEGLDAWFVSPEDLILLKLVANRLKDRVDAVDVMLVVGHLDDRYLREWAEKLNVLDRLNEVAQELS